MSKYIFYWVKKRLVWGVLNRRERDENNETGLKEGRGIEMSNYSAFHIRDARSLRFCIYLPLIVLKFLDVALNFFP